MKRIGILAGISPESTRLYYEQIVKAYHARRGGCYYPEIVIFSLNFQRFTELAVGRVLPGSRARLLEIMAGSDVEGVILGCTELPMILRPEEPPLPLLNTLALHAEAALDHALDESVLGEWSSIGCA